MDPGVKDWLQLGFSFWVAGYLLVWGQRAVHSLAGAVADQKEILGRVVAALDRTNDLLDDTRSDPRPRRPQTPGL